MTTFYIHEDDWGMHCIIPAENFDQTKDNFQESNELSERSFDGIGWKEIYVIPEEKVSILERNISFQEIKSLLEPFLPLATEVESGYSSYRESCPNSFAFGNSYKIAFYGNKKGEIVSSLNFLNYCTEMEELKLEQLSNALFALGSKYNLILADWQYYKLINLSNLSAIKTYLLNEDEEE